MPEIDTFIRDYTAERQLAGAAACLLDRDGIFWANAYGLPTPKLYRRGDPEISLRAWVEGYLQPGGDYYVAAENFHAFAPAAALIYNNVAFGLVGYLVERLSGRPFAEYSRDNVFLPLGMTETSWRLADLDLSRHVVPYTYREGDDIRSPDWGGSPLDVIREGAGPTVPEGDGHHANCIYSHPNYPDGFLRTSVRQLARAAQAYLNGGVFEGRRLLEAASAVRPWLFEREREAAGDFFAARVLDGYRQGLDDVCVGEISMGRVEEDRSADDGCSSRIVVGVLPVWCYRMPALFVEVPGGSAATSQCGGHPGPLVEAAEQRGDA